MDQRLLNEIHRSKKLMGVNEGLNLPHKKTQTQDTWIGTDVDIETSLFEYGLIARQPDPNNPDEWQVIHSVTFGDDGYAELFDYGFYSESDLNKLVKGEEWANESDIESFLSSSGIDLDEFLNMSFINKLSDLIDYWGTENILGSSYNGMNKNEVINLVNKHIEPGKELSLDIDPEDPDQCPRCGSTSTEPHANGFHRCNDCNTTYDFVPVDDED